MNVREEARRVGGDELVAKFDEARTLSERVLKDVLKIVDDTMTSADGNSEREKLYITALTEALADAYARVCVAFGELTGSSKGEVLLLAVKAAHTSINHTHEALEAQRSGVSDMIMEAVKKGAK